MSYSPGPFDSKHYYLQWGGTLPGNEEFSCGIRLANTAGGDPVYDVGAHTAYTNAIKAFHSAANSGIGPFCNLTYTKLNVIGTDGKYTEAVTHEQVVTPLAGGGTGTTLMPNQVALVVSLTTDVTRGPANRGRFYVPLPNFPVASDGRISAANAALLSGTVDTLIAAINAYSANIKAAVFSRKLGAPAHRLVLGNVVGRVYDTQRRRRRSLDEAWA